jgi:L-ascorbate metabolism protein UlaG (beta-lactamase superfamily)
MLFPAFSIPCAAMKNPENHKTVVRSNFDGAKFRNEHLGDDQDNGFLKLLKWQFAGGSKPWPKSVADNAIADLRAVTEPRAANVSFINHATSLIRTPDLTLITDPVFSERVSPLRWLGPRRRRAAGAAFAETPKIDAVLLSHNHYDHMDIASLAEVQERDRPLFVVPLGNRKYLRKIGSAHIVELDWWESLPVNGSTITLVPMQHWSLRGTGRRRDALWGGYVIESNELKILFSGDTGYNSHFRSIREKFGAFDASLLPIGAYEPRWFMQKFHMNPGEAVQAHLDLQSSLSIAIHFGTFKLSDEGMDDPLIALQKALSDLSVPANRFITPKNGETIFVRK